MDFEVQVGELQDLERLEFAADLDGHVPSGRIAVAEVQHHDRSAVGGADVGHLVDERVGEAPGRKVQVSLVRGCDR